MTTTAINMDAGKTPGPAHSLFQDGHVFASFADASAALNRYVETIFTLDGSAPHAGVETYAFTRVGAEGFSVFVRRNGWRSGDLGPQALA